jgi:hypothetical protein
MTNAAAAVVAAVSIALLTSTSVSAQDAVVVAVPARGGPVQGTTENSDAFIRRKLTEFVVPVVPSQRSPVVFETWASDADTFSHTPRWPDPNQPKRLQVSALQLMKRLPALESPAPHYQAPIDVTCSPPPGAAAGGFPLSDVWSPCITEETKRNRAQFDYIVNNKLNTRAGLAAAFARSLKVDMPVQAMAVKGDWVPVEFLLQWIPQLGNRANIERLYYTTKVDSAEFALLSLHVSSRQNPNWVWGTFEHQMNPGRCDYIGCFDTFGAERAAVSPNKATMNTQYGTCPKTQPLKTLMQNARLSPVWENYCLKSTQVDYAAADGTPYVLGNSVIEGIVGNGTVAASSCMGCHAYASFDASGATKKSVRAMLPFNPIGKPIPSVLAGSSGFHFMWGVLLAP